MGRTLDAENADIFVVPAYLKYIVVRYSKKRRLLEELLLQLVEHLRSEGPFWDR